MTVPAAGKLSARLTRGAKLIASGSRKAAAAGPATRKLRLRAGVGARTLRGKLLLLRVEWAGAGGANAAATAKVRAR